MNKKLIISAAMLMSVFATACGSAAKTGESNVINVKMIDNQITIDKNSASSGVVKFVVTNGGTKVHEFVIEAAGTTDAPFELDGKASELEDLKPGATGTLEWNLKPGKYQGVCYYENHAEIGEKVEFTIN